MPGTRGILIAIPEPLPGAPPALIRASGPLMAMPLASSRMKLPPAFTVSSLSASITIFCPAFRWISRPALAR